MRNLKLLPATVDSEREVVEEEKRLRVDNDPIGKALEKFRALAYTKHPYNWTPIGTIEDLEKVTPADCQKLLRHLLPAQQRDADRRRRRRRGDGAAAGRQALRPDPARPGAAARRRRAEPPQTAMRDGDAERRGADPGGRRRLPHPARPPIPTSPALEVLAAILSGGESSRHAPAAGPQGAPGARRRRA